MKQTLLIGAAFVALVLSCFGQTPPPNDDFANRTVLTGNIVAFSGTLAGATIENKETLGGFFTNAVVPITQSVWWTWTAPQTSLVTVEMTGASGDEGPEAGIAVYDTTNVFAQTPPVALRFLDLAVLCPALTFSAIKGSNYQFQVLGKTSLAYQFLLSATDNPVILQEPRNLTVSPNASTLFTVVAEGYRPLNYQWQLAGTNLPGQTAPMLALTNIDSTQAGNYTVVISNSGGAVTSAPATLVVSSTAFPASLTAIEDQFGQFSFALRGEVGRNYRVESSTDLVNWTNEYSFPPHEYSALKKDYDYDIPALTSVVFNTNDSSTFILGADTVTKFLRVSEYHPVNEICINNLRQIRFAKALWLRDDQPFPIRSDTLTGVDIAPYFVQGVLPCCPLDPMAQWVNSYNAAVANCATTPGCQIEESTHLLEEPQ